MSEIGREIGAGLAQEERPGARRRSEPDPELEWRAASGASRGHGEHDRSRQQGHGAGEGGRRDEVEAQHGPGEVRVRELEPEGGRGLARHGGDRGGLDGERAARLLDPQGEGVSELELLVEEGDGVEARRRRGRVGLPAERAARGPVPGGRRGGAAGKGRALGARRVCVPAGGPPGREVSAVSPLGIGALVIRIVTNSWSTSGCRTSVAPAMCPRKSSGVGTLSDAGR